MIELYYTTFLIISVYPLVKRKAGLVAFYSLALEIPIAGRIFDFW